MAKLHIHYITNAQKELKYAYAGVSEDDFQSSIRDALNGSDDFNEDEGDDFFDDDDDENGENDDNGNGDDNGEKVIMIQMFLIKKLQKSKNGLI
jgi:hypothetical protein